MSTGTVWNYRDFINREHGSEEAIEFEIAIRKYQAEQIAHERARIIKLLETLNCSANGIEHDCNNDLGGYTPSDLIGLIKGEQK